MSELFTLLIRKRATVKGKLTLFKKYLAEVETSILELREGSKLDKSILIESETRLDKIVSLLGEYDEIQNEIETNCDETELEKYLLERESFQNMYYKCVTRTKQILEDFAEKQEDNSSESGDSRVSVSFQVPQGSLQASTGLTNQGTVKLPLINLPTFNGLCIKWLEFKDTFESLIHKNNDIGEIQKFHYLRAQLVGPAKQAIESLEFSATNYNIAWESLCKRYDNKRILLQNHISGIYEISPLKNESSEGLRNLCDTVSKHLRALENLGRPVQHWDDLVIFILASKLDRTSLKEWEGLKMKIETPSFIDFKEFIKGRADLLETLEHTKTRTSNQFSQKSKYERTFVSVNEKTCVFCKNVHEISKCKKFLGLPIHSRVTFVKRNRLCMCCFSENHFSNSCDLKCTICGLGHSTLLHYHNRNSPKKTDVEKYDVEGRASGSAVSEEKSVTMSTRNYGGQGQVLLSTALVRIKDTQGNSHDCKVLLDSASMSNFITERMVEKLGLKPERVNVSVVGIGQGISNISKRCNVEIYSHSNNFKISASCLVIPKISEEIPLYEVNLNSFDVPQDICLANPYFYQPEEVDMLVGASIFWKLLRGGQIHLGEGKPVLQNTCLGWVVSGEVSRNCYEENKPQKTICNLNIDLDVQDQIEKFWLWEEPSVPKKCVTLEEEECERLFVSTTVRDKEGRFIVEIPFKDSVDKLADSRHMALNRLFSLERRLSKNDSLRTHYCEYMAEYEKAGHMTRVNEVSENQVSYFLPHHGVVKEESLTTKLRVVYDGSARSDSGLSINDLQYIGPKIQSDLIYILLRFRQRKVAFCADISKMYRQVWVDEKQRALQRILWRSNPSEEVQTYNLNTVVFGLSSSPFLAIRCLKELAMEHSQDFPRASKLIETDFYVDDLISGTQTRDEAIQVCEEISEILKSAGFLLRKFCSNDKLFLSKMGSADQNAQMLVMGENEKTKTLGLLWDYGLDNFTYKVGMESDSNCVTKRKILSQIAQIFDPLGLVSASIIIPKIIMQKLWLYKLSWDDEIPEELKREWLRFKKEISALNSLDIPRFVSCDNPVRIEIHGFSDASQQALGACVYIRSVDKSDAIVTRLLCAKSKVAPIKTCTIPKLELSAALLLSKLVREVYDSADIHIDDIFLWCDSSVTLGWIRSPANHFNQFVSNRVSQIQTLTQCHNWHYVRSNENPADLVSRGISPSKLKGNTFWFHGPDWLSSSSECLPTQNDLNICLEQLPEKRKNIKSLVSLENDPFILFVRYSKFGKMKRVFAYCLRFINNCRKGENRLDGELSVSELDTSEMILVKIAQKECFLKEINLIQRKECVKKGKLSSLNPFLDDKNLLRVGGRIRLSNYDFNKKFPIVLGAKHILTEVIIRAEHERLMHAGPQMVLSVLREKYWPIRGRDLVRKVVHKCVVCAKAQPKSFEIQMGNLPKARLMPQPPFHTSGVDYAGPFNFKLAQGRGNRTYKGYVCLFICFTTRAIHLEVVTSLSTDSFIAAFRRFVSRRGKPLKIYSDNGKNFTGAHSTLRELGNFLWGNHGNLEQLLKNEGIEWSFIPVYSPHFGGIWEAGVKSVKYHLKRVVGNVNLSYEDFGTVLCQIEAIVNSRPLTPMSSDPCDLDTLTPAHFLIGRRLTSLPDKNLIEVNENRLLRFQKLQQIQQKFWLRWSREYVSELQSRVKWKHNKDNLKIGTLVLIKADSIPPLCWKVGRVIQVYPGDDGVNRVALLKTAEGQIKRSYAKLCPLPVDE